MKINRMIIAPVALITMLSGCQSPIFATANDQNSTTYEQCTRLKRQIIFYRSDLNYNYRWNSPGNKAILLNDYQRLNCDEVLAHKNDVQSSKRPMSSGWNGAEQSCKR